jgi:hypothetical protein
MVAPELDRQARQSVSKLAGHARIRASGACLGAVRRQRLPDAHNDDGVPGQDSCQEAAKAPSELPQSPLTAYPGHFDQKIGLSCQLRN